MRRARKAERGQAVVELALGMLVFITILVFGIHFAEVSYPSMRVQQAAAYAIYDATAQRAHEKGNGNTRYSTVAGLVTSEARKRWYDFNANTGGDWAAQKMSHVFTEIDRMQIQCTNENSITYSTNPTAPPVTPLTPNPYSNVGNRGGLKCTASAEVGIFNFPKSFFDDEWNLKEKHYAAQKEKYTICATPRATNGSCGTFGLLVGDFSLQGRDESLSHDLFSGGNNAFRDLASDATGLISCPASLALSGTIAYTASPGACGFQFSYKGVEANYRQNIQGAHTGPTTWITGGTNSKRTGPMQRIALGVQRNW